MAKKAHLPIYGVGPFCAASMVVLLLIGFVLQHFGFLESGKIERLRIPFFICGILLIALALWIWIQAVLVSKIDQAILQDQLVTTGIYSWVRNPIYSAIALALSGVALLFTNAWLLFLPPLYWLNITIWMKASEEKWLTERYGQAYLDYCKQVNRCIPWFPKKK